MPNILLEYTANVTEAIDYKALFIEIHNILHEVAGIKLDNCKSRVSAIEHFHIGDGHPANAFVQMSISFLVGRSDEAKQNVGAACLDSLKRSYSKSMGNLDLQITVELIDIRGEDYFKYPDGTFTPQ